MGHRFSPQEEGAFIDHTALGGSKPQAVGKWLQQKTFEDKSVRVTLSIKRDLGRGPGVWVQAGSAPS